MCSSLFLIWSYDPDDTQSLVLLLVMLDRLELEGFISQHAWVPYGQGALELINGIIDEYERVWPNLVLHSKDFPSADYEKVNHHPVAIVAKDAGTKIMYKTIKAGRSLLLDVSRSYDPDGFY